MFPETPQGKTTPIANFGRRFVIWNLFTGGYWLARTTMFKTARAETAPEQFPDHVTAESYAAMMRGLNWLASRQRSDGGFGGANSYSRNVGVCALVGMAFLSHQGPRGPFQDHIRNCTDYLLAMSRSNGFIVEDDVKTHAPMYGHGFATMYLSQICGTDRRAEVREKLKLATKLILQAQNESGAWRYTPFPDDADVSVTTCQMMALLAARQAGVTVPGEAIQRSVEFLLRCQNPDGGFRYRLIDPPESLFPRSAAAAVALSASGFSNHPAVQKARPHLMAPGAMPVPVNAEYYFYGRFYATHAALQQGKDVWEQFYPNLRDELLQRQSVDGFWSDPNIGDEYATAMALICLQSPFGSLPLFLL